MQESVVITGAMGGIGRVLCSFFREKGYYVIGVDCHNGDVTTDAFILMDIEKAVNDTAYWLEQQELLITYIEGTRLKGLVNNAAYQVIKPFIDLDLTDWLKTFNINLMAPVLFSRLLVPLLEKESATIINISSIHAALTKPQFVCYATSKAALLGLTRSLAVELGSRIKVCAICPAAIDTPMLQAGFEGNPEAFAALCEMHPSHCIGQPEDVAKLAVFLIESPTQFYNGMIINMDGGILFRLHDPL